MCGIAGVIFETLEPAAARWLTAMTQAMYHRGPDSGGAVVFGLGGKPSNQRKLGKPGEPVEWEYLPAQVGLGVRRLAVIDPSDAGAQPMSSEDSRTWIAFNGAIYNFRSIRDELRSAGMSFRGNSDTEVLLAAYRHWGTECFARLEGMWAVAILDLGAQRLVLSRDPLGIKPLYLTRLSGGIAFASEIGALLTIPGVSREADEQLLCDFLSRGLVDHTDRTVFAGIWAMPPGCYLTAPLRTGSLPRPWEMKGYWEPPPMAARPQGGSLRQLLERSVAAHLVGDVPVGSCLSGGLDSSTIVTLIHEFANAPDSISDRPELSRWSQHTFTACLTGHALDECRHADAVVRACGDLKWHRVEPTAAGLLEQMDALIRHQEQPFGSPSIYMQWEVMRAAHEAGVTVLLDGQGGDELFCGYEGFVPPFLAHLLMHGRIGRAAQEARAAVRHHYFSRMSLMAHSAAHMLPADFRDVVRRRLNRLRQPWLVGELFDAEPSDDIRTGLNVAFAGGRIPLGRFNTYTWNLLTSESLPALLRYEDRNSMAFSIEARVPFLDRALVDLALSMPADEKIVGGRLKAPLREAAQGLVPDEIINRRDKIGFAAPTAEWMRGDLAPWWREAVTSKAFRERGCFNNKGVERLVSRFERGENAVAILIWRMAVVEHWARQFLDGPNPAIPG